MNWKLIWKSLSDPDMRKRILIVLGILVVFRMLAHVPIPLSNPENLRQVLESLFTSQETPQFLNFVKQQASSLAGLGDITAGSSLMQWALMVAALTGGAMMLMWLGELITEQNIGNGISLLITVGIIASLPTTVASLISS